KAVYSHVLDQLGVSPDDEKGGKMSVDPMAIGAAADRAAQLMGGATPMAAQEAVAQAIKETVDLDGSHKDPTFLSRIGLGAGDAKPTAKKKVSADPLGLFSGR